MNSAAHAVSVLVIAILCTVLPLAHAQSWPVKPVRMLVSTGPGLSTDIIGRLLAERLSRALGQQFVVENIAGAGGNIAAQVVARAAPDGYTLLFTGGGTLVTNAYAFKTLPFDPERDFVPVALITRASGFLIAVTPDLAVKSLAELIGLARSRPGALAYAIDVSNIYLQLIARMLNREAGIDITEIPYKSTQQAILDTIAGRTQMIIASIPALQPVLNAGKLRLVAVTSSARLANYPAIPTLLESYSAMQMDAVGFSVVAPAATAQEIVQRLNRTIVMILKDARLEEQFAAQGVSAAAPLSPDEAAEELRNQRQRWGKIFRDLAIQPQ